MPQKAFKQVWKSVTGNPGADLSTKRYCFVKYNANGEIVAATAGSNALGVLEEPNTVGQPAQVVADGFMFVKLGAVLSAGTDVMSNANGEAVAYAVGTAPAYNVLLGTLVVGGAVGEIGTIKLRA